MSRDPHTPQTDPASDATPDTGHNYDGIREYDNPLPGWWVWIFWITIIWGFIYIFFAFLPPKMFSGETSLETEKAEMTARVFGALPDLQLDDATILEYSQKPEWTAIGRSMFQANCVSCHASDGQGSVGPNLTDNAYINVKTPADIADVIANGRKNGAMPAWGKFFEKKEQVMLAAYVASLRGENRPGKAAEGEVPAMPWGKSAGK